ncbi:hypothetical protein POM88_044180 [Heracleum sosnowskyi]|uniref:Transposase-associated domain-containing protein n=1 Tax=Heracleum sosnowskyi TaxID=360622 RepID=A0AAD8H3A9_9APIA|nr:hypothetical protein POM88_044180 [Heracleum sosnowskyi]
MDRHTWMYKISPATADYIKGVEDFITYAMLYVEKKHKEEGKEQMILCPCRNCNNFKKYRSVDTVRDHLFRRGFKEGYEKWIWHGEGLVSTRTSGTKRGREEDSMEKNDDEDMENDMVQEMIQDMEDHFMNQPDILNNLVDDSKKLLYHGCKDQFTRLSTTLKLCKLKVKHNWSDKSFTEMLQLLGEILPTSSGQGTSFPIK